MTAQAIYPFATLASGTLNPSIPVNDNALRSEVKDVKALGFADSAPGSPTEGDQWIVGTTWGGFTTDNIVVYKGGTWLEFVPFAGQFKKIGAAVYIYDASWSVAIPANLTPLIIPVAISDETTALSAGAAKVTFRMPCAMTLGAVRASLTTAQTSGSIFTVDINEGGTTILSTKLTIDNTEKTSTTAATPAVISDTALADDSEITIDIDQIGDGTAKGLKVYLIGVAA